MHITRNTLHLCQENHKVILEGDKRKAKWMGERAMFLDEVKIVKSVLPKLIYIFQFNFKN